MRAAGRALHRFAALLGFLLILITVTPVLGWWTSALGAPWGPNDGDTLIVLGADQTARGVPGVSSYWRSYYAVLVWRGGHFQRVIVTGKDVAGPMRDFMAAQGVPADAIMLENAANTTRENALFVAPMLKGLPGRSILLTSDYHSRRALNAFRAAGVSLTALPFPDARQRLESLMNRWDIFCVLSLETLKTAYYAARGWT